MSGLTALGILLAHLVGDYLLQTHWMASQKLSRWWPAAVHGSVYTLPYVFVTQSVWALLIIGGTHVVIDRLRLARYVCWVRNQVVPKTYRFPLTETGYPASVPAGLATALLIISDNTLHLLINTAAVLWL